MTGTTHSARFASDWRSQSADAGDGVVVFRRNLVAMLKDFMLLTKPSIVRMTVVMVYAGIALAPIHPSWLITCLTLLGVACSVGSANALNMYLEQETDALMLRTKDRPIASGRMKPRSGLLFGLFLGLLSMGILFFATNVLTTVLAATAIALYVLVYTPMKRLSTHALLVGAIPGAMPPLLGWTAATNTISSEGIALFLVLLVWQLPHFLAISIYSAEDYARANFPVVSLKRGERNAKLQTLAYSSALLPVSLSLYYVGVAGWTYLAAAVGGGIWLLYLAAMGLRLPSAKTDAWARTYFVGTLFYLPLLAMALVVDRVLL